MAPERAAWNLIFSELPQVMSLESASVGLNPEASLKWCFCLSYMIVNWISFRFVLMIRHNRTSPCAVGYYICLFFTVFWQIFSLTATGVKFMRYSPLKAVLLYCFCCFLSITEGQTAGAHLIDTFRVKAGKAQQIRTDSLKQMNAHYEIYSMSYLQHHCVFIMNYAEFVLINKWNKLNFK